ncbi:MAG: tetratricopeptide repeat protein [Chloroflexi bacterium]|nr:tetratricopeptide repeat protein [Chloroflexota bacterium]
MGLNVQGDPHQAVRQWLRDKRLLLVLDNFEHLLEATPFVVDLLEAALGLQILVTSRERLNVRGEHLYTIPALAYDPAQTGSQAIADLPSVQLFLQSAQRTQANFSLETENEAAVLNICRLVQGMPLGLELAAAWVGTLPIQTIADAITQSNDFLAADWRDAPARQRSMRAVFEWSWQLLNPLEQQVLCQLAVFHGGFTRRAAQTVTGATLPVLTRLVHKSLVQWAESDQFIDQGRYTVHELLRQFAAEKLAQISSKQATIQAGHSRFYLAFVAERTLRLVRREPSEAGAEIQQELDNVRQAWAWAAAHGEIASLDQAAYGWWQFCRWHGLRAEGRQFFTVAVQGVRAWLADANQQHEAAQKNGKRLLSKLLALHADLLFAQGIDEQMAAEAREAIALGQTHGSIEGETFGHFVLGRAYQEFEQLANAIAAWQKAIALARADQQGPTPSVMVADAEWMAHAWLRGAALAQEDYAGSRAHMLQALQICQAIGQVRGELNCLTNLAWNDFLVGDYAAARQRFEQGFQLASTLKHRWGEMATGSGLGEMMRLQGKYTQALHWFERSLAIATEYSPYDEAFLIAMLVRLHSTLGDQAGAEQWRRRLFQLLDHTPLPKDCQRQSWLAAAVQAYYAGEAQRALTYAEQARHLTGPGDILNTQADALVFLGHTQAGLQQWAAAGASYEEAITCYHKGGNMAAATEAQAGLAQIALAQGDLAQAQRWVEAILPILAAEPRAGFNTPFFTYLTGYRVLAANQDARAKALLAQGWRLLLAYAAEITDPALRRSFLEAVAVHRELQALYQAYE